MNMLPGCQRLTRRRDRLTLPRSSGPRHGVCGCLVCGSSDPPASPRRRQPASGRRPSEPARATDTGRAKIAARRGPAIITDRGGPAHVRLTFADHQRLTGGQDGIIDLPNLPPGVEDAGSAGHRGPRPPWNQVRIWNQVIPGGAGPRYMDLPRTRRMGRLVETMSADRHAESGDGHRP